jgi:cyanophycin synthetase
VVPQSVLPNGASVLNADNPYTVEMTRTARGELIFFSMDEDNPVIRDHLRERGKAVVLRPTRHGEMITLIEHRRDTSLLLAEEIPATMEGRIRVNIANALAAAAAAFAQDVQLEYIRNALRTFTSTFFQTPGRFNLLEIEGRRVLLDYCHNVAGLESMADFVKRMDADRTIAMIALPGDRSDADISAFGRLAGSTFDEIVIREDANPRGRKRGEVAGLLVEAIAAGGQNGNAVDVVLDEVEAARAAIARAERNDLVILMADKPALVFEQLTGRTS